MTKNMKQKGPDSPARWAVRRSSIATAESPVGARAPAATVPGLIQASVGALGAAAVPGELLEQLNRMEVSWHVTFACVVTLSLR